MSPFKPVPAMPVVSRRARLAFPRAAFMAMAVAIITAGCASGPDDREPALPQTAAGPFVSHPSNTDVAEAPPANWWKLYDEPALDNLVQEALSANTNLRVAMANHDRARAIYTEARSGQFPSTSMSGGVGYGRDQTTWSGTG